MWHANTAITYSTGHHPIFKIISKEECVMSTAWKCPNCDQWFSTSGGLRQHFNACRSKNDASADVDVDMEQQQHPLQSMHPLHRNDVVDQDKKCFCDHEDINISN